MNARGTKHEARILVMAMMVLGSSAALAMPTQQELKKAQPLVAELMSPTMDDFKAKKKTAAEVADMAVKYAGEAETEAAKFMLYRSSIPYYVRGEAYDKAADAVELMKANVKDVPASVIEEIISKATVRATAKKAPRLFELYRQAKAQSVAEKDIVALRAKLKKNPGSLPIVRNLAEALATSGDWDAALEEFAKLKDGAAQIAKKELDCSAKSVELGEFWWSYKPTYENADDTFEMHAAVHYRKALDAGEISGLKKNIVEQRIKPYGDAVAAGGQGASPRTPAATTPSTGSIELKTGGASPFTVKGNEATLELKNGAKLEFVKCPSGWVKVVDDYENKTVRKVEITRPFWIMKQGLRNDDVIGRTLEKWGTGHGFIEPNQEVRDKFCSDLTDELKGVLPKGYVVRPPSLVEWEYAYHAGDEDPGSEPFGSLLKFHDWSTFDTHKGTSPVNKWGLHDFHVAEQVFDRVDPSRAAVKVNKKDKKNITKLPNAQSDKDVFFWSDDCDSASYLVRWPTGCALELKPKNSRTGFVRLVIGPDLVSEWKAKNGKK